MSHGFGEFDHLSVLVLVLVIDNGCSAAFKGLLWPEFLVASGYSPCRTALQFIQPYFDGETRRNRKGPTLLNELSPHRSTIRLLPNWNTTATQRRPQASLRLDPTLAERPGYCVHLIFRWDLWVHTDRRLQFARQRLAPQVGAEIPAHPVAPVARSPDFRIRVRRESCCPIRDTHRTKEPELCV